jgi:hypothetical protein
MPTAVRARGRDGGCTSSVGRARVRWHCCRPLRQPTPHLCAGQGWALAGSPGHVDSQGCLKARSQSASVEWSLAHLRRSALCAPRALEGGGGPSNRPSSLSDAQTRVATAPVETGCARPARPMPVRVQCPGTGHERTFRRPPRSQADGRCRAVGSVAFFAGRRPHSTNLRRCQFRVLFASR